MKTEFESMEFKAKADAYWEPPMCKCDDVESPDGKAGWYCDECGREIPARDPNPMCDFGNRGED